jgi:putative transposase
MRGAPGPGAQKKQILRFMRQADAGVIVADLGREDGFSSPTFWDRRAHFGVLETSDAQQRRELDAEDAVPKNSAGLGVAGHEAPTVAFAANPAPLWCVTYRASPGSTGD